MGDGTRRELPDALRRPMQQARRRVWQLGLLRVLALGVAVAGLIGLPLLALLPHLASARGLRVGLALLVLLGLAAVVLRELWIVRRATWAPQLARLVEHATPELGDRLTTSVALLSALPPGASAQLAASHVEQTASLVRRAQAVRRLGRQLWRDIRVAGLACVVGLVVAAGLLAIAPQRLRQGLASLSAVEGAATAPALLPPLVTDITLTYRYPAYMQRPDKVLEGSTGDISAPRGTTVQVRALADRPLVGAAMEIEGERIPLELTPPRELRGQLMVNREVRYRFVVRTARGEQSEREGHAIHVEVDEAPEVRLLKPADDLVVRENDVIEVEYQARDDVGLGELSLAVTNLRGGEPQRTPLDSVEGRLAALGGNTRLDLAGLRVAPGDRLAITIEATDTDTVSGPKTGRSEQRILKVFSAVEHHDALLTELRAVFDRLVQVLADELENPFATVAADRAAADAQMTQAQASANALHEALAALGEVILKFRDDRLAPPELRRALRYVRRELRPLADQNETLLSALESYLEASGTFQPAYAARIAQGQKRRQEALERHILYLDDLYNRERMDAARLVTEELTRSQQKLAELLQQYRDSGDEGVRRQILDELERLRQQITELQQQLAQLRREVPEGYINPEALADRDLLDPIERIQQLLADGRIEEAMRELDRLRTRTQEQRDRMDSATASFGGEAYTEQRQRLARLWDDLQDIEASQRTLADRTAQQYERQVRELRQSQAGRIDELARRLAREAREAAQRIAHIDEDRLAAFEAEYRAAAHERLEETRRALEGRDLEAARESVTLGLRALQALQVSQERFSDALSRAGDPATRRNQSLAAEALHRTEVIDKALQKLFPSPDNLKDPALKRSLREQARAQRELGRRTEQAQGALQKLGEELPLFGPEHEGLLRQAADQMGQASRQLDGQDLATAREAQREALSRLGELRQAMEQMGKGSGGAGMPMPWAGVGADGDGDGDGPRREKVEIPKAEASQAPAAFRRDILDAMKEPAPEGFREQVKRYYEELVK